jgi:hypothetical protein
MAGADRMTVEEVVKRVLLDEHADVIREAVKAVAAKVMELEAWSSPLRRTPDPLAPAVRERMVPIVSKTR